MDKTSTRTVEPANGGDDSRKAKAEHFQSIRDKVEELDEVCAHAQQIIRDLRRMLRR
jgi:hypothetical protein